MTVRDAFVDVVLQTTSYELELELLDDRDRLKTSWDPPAAAVRGLLHDSIEIWSQIQQHIQNTSHSSI